MWICATHELTSITYFFPLQNKMRFNCISSLSRCRPCCPRLGTPAFCESWTLAPGHVSLFKTHNKKRGRCARSLETRLAVFLATCHGRLNGARASSPVYTPVTRAREAKHLLCETQTSLSHLRWLDRSGRGLRTRGESTEGKFVFCTTALFKYPFPSSAFIF